MKTGWTTRSCSSAGSSRKKTSGRSRKRESPKFFCPAPRPKTSSDLSTKTSGEAIKKEIYQKEPRTSAEAAATPRKGVFYLRWHQTCDSKCKATYVHHYGNHLN